METTKIINIIKGPGMIRTTKDINVKSLRVMLARKKPELKHRVLKFDHCVVVVSVDDRPAKETIL